MGCDIHPRVEIRDEAGWHPVPDLEVWDFRSYSVFGWLAGVRNYSAVEPLTEPRGFPADASEPVREDFEKWKMDAHTPSWLTLAELLAVDYEAEVNDRRVTRQIAPNAWDGGCTGEPEEGTREPLREFLGVAFMRDLAYLVELGDPENVRVVFWFDN